MKVSLVLILFIMYLQYVFKEYVTYFVFFSGPAHILCLTVASGWNKERCMTVVGIKITVTEKYSIFCTIYLLRVYGYILCAFWTF
jgi:hypothetical protein